MINERTIFLSGLDCGKDRELSNKCVISKIKCGIIKENIRKYGRLERQEMHITFWFGNLSGRDGFGDRE